MSCSLYSAVIFRSSPSSAMASVWIERCFEVGCSQIMAQSHSHAPSTFQNELGASSKSSNTHKRTRETHKQESRICNQDPDRTGQQWLLWAPSSLRLRSSFFACACFFLLCGAATAAAGLRRAMAHSTGAFTNLLRKTTPIQIFLAGKNLNALP